MTETLKITHSNRVRRPLGLARCRTPNWKAATLPCRRKTALSDHCVVFALQTVDGSVQEETNASADLPRPPSPRRLVSRHVMVCDGNPVIVDTINASRDLRLGG